MLSFPDEAYIDDSFDDGEEEENYGGHNGNGNRDDNVVKRNNNKPVHMEVFRPVSYVVDRGTRYDRAYLIGFLFFINLIVKLLLSASNIPCVL